MGTGLLEVSAAIGTGTHGFHGVPHSGANRKNRHIACLGDSPYGQSSEDRLVAFLSPVRANLPNDDARITFKCTGRVSELASGLTRNQVPRKGLWVRIPCPPLLQGNDLRRFDERDKDSQSHGMTAK